MARPTKTGLDYFNLDTELEDKVKLLEAKYNLEGFAIWVKLLQKIYRHGYYINWHEENILLFSNEINVNINLINDIINDCLRWQIFDEKLYNKYMILTSRGIQKRYLEAAKRRKEVEMIKEFCVVSGVNDYNNLVFVNINSINGNRKYTKESKVKESKVKESNSNSCSDSKKSPNDTPEKIKFDKESIQYKAALHLRKLILENNSRQPVPDDTVEDLQDWALEIDRLNRLGPIGCEEKENKGYSWKEIGKIMEWCQDDTFWRKNIKSANKFRKQITRLEDDMKSGDKEKSKEKINQLKKLYIEAQKEDEEGYEGADVL